MMTSMAATMNLSKLKLNDLKKELKERSLPISGNKSDLVARLKSFMDEHEPTDTDDILADTSNSSTIGEGHDQDLELGGVDDIEENVEDEILKDDGALQLDGDDPPDTVLDDKLEDTLGIESTTVDSSQDAVTKAEITLIDLHSDDEKCESSSPDKTHDDAKVKSLKATLTASERMSIRAKKFGVVSEDTKKKTRGERFGSTEESEVVSSTTEGGSIGTSVKTTDIKRLKDRADRFGSSVAPTMNKLEATEKLLKRHERFGSADSAFSKKVQRLEDTERLKERQKRFGALTSATVSTATSSEMDEKRKRRAERFGQITSTTGGGTTTSGEVDEKKRKRDERFGSSP